MRRTLLLAALWPSKAFASCFCFAELQLYLLILLAVPLFAVVALLLALFPRVLARPLHGLYLYGTPLVSFLCLTAQCPSGRGDDALVTASLVMVGGWSLAAMARRLSPSVAPRRDHIGDSAADAGLTHPEEADSAAPVKEP